MVQYRFGSTAVMRYLVLCVVLSYIYAASLESAREIFTKQMEINKKCMAEGKLNESEINAKFRIGEVPEGEEVKCLLACIMKGMGYLTDDGKIDWSVMEDISRKQYTNPEDLQWALDDSAVCSKSVPQDLGNACEVAYNATNCFLEEARKRQAKL
ncbi:general odorant-binding protein 28a [Halyomorpha halys]|uniref:general odorant-binding protein 28a n=1 Tax=Halyomorpha halys TaxID=286706 RepID=UPI0006D4DD6A|nr:uncharacterized protein LOC106684062 [Halyomorpha halys]